MRIQWNGLSVSLLFIILFTGVFIKNKKDKRHLESISALQSLPCLYVSKTMIASVDDPSSPTFSSVIYLIIVKNHAYRNSILNIEAGKSYRMEFGVIQGKDVVLSAELCNSENPTDSSLKKPREKPREIPDHRRSAPFAPYSVAEFFYSYFKPYFVALTQLNMNVIDKCFICDILFT